MGFDPAKLGPPDFKMGAFCIWIWGRQFEESDDYWDGNWLRVLAHCGALGSSVWAEGAILRLSELKGWQSGLEALLKSASGTASLECIEPNLHATVSLGSRGSGTLTIKITPDHMTQAHKFTLEIDQTFLPEAVNALRKILERYPIRGTSPSGQ